MSQTAKVQEPSMEEILASIRRIIADDDGQPAKSPEAAAPASPPVAAAPIRPTPPEPEPTDTGKNQSEVDAMLADLDEPKQETPAPPQPATPPPAGDVFELTEADVAPPPAPSFHTIEGNSDVIFTDRTAETTTEGPARRAGVTEERRLLSNATTAAVDSAFNSLAATVLGHNARTLEDLVKEMLRPLLKSWLDDNLPGLVERIVRAEIERVSRGKP